MIKILSIVIASLTLFTATGFADEVKPVTAADMVAANPALEGRLVEVQVNGMVCDFCAQSLTKVLQKKDSVEKVDISLETKLMIITQAEGKTISDEEVTEAVTWAGYDIASIKRV
jgi:copper chaperone CopZ